MVCTWCGVCELFVTYLVCGSHVWCMCGCLWCVCVNLCMCGVSVVLVLMCVVCVAECMLCVCGIFVVYV